MKGSKYPSMELFGYVLLEAYDISTTCHTPNKVVKVKNKYEVYSIHYTGMR